ncbi:MAG TPA: hypothetical protein VHV30_13700, partial [Polyangiaceae bacterium]|nr:hypothetical protein [Polyangiaceae bacterium]
VEPRALAAGGVWLGTPVVRAGLTTLALLGPTTETAVTVDPSGREVAHALLATRPAIARGDAGAPAVETAHAAGALLVDPSGTLVFVTIVGDAGAVAPLRDRGDDAAAASEGEPNVEILADVCPRPAAASTASAAAGVAPLDVGAFAVACRSGSVVGIEGVVARDGRAHGEGGGGGAGEGGGGRGGKSTGPNL